MSVLIVRGHNAGKTQALLVEVAGYVTRLEARASRQRELLRRVLRMTDPPTSDPMLLDDIRAQLAQE